MNSDPRLRETALAETLTRHLLQAWARHPSTTPGEIGTPLTVFYSVERAVEVLTPVIAALAASPAPAPVTERAYVCLSCLAQVPIIEVWQEQEPGKPEPTYTHHVKGGHPVVRIDRWTQAALYPPTSHATADWHGPLVAAERRVAELEALVLEYQAAERALYVARCVDDGGSDDINHCRKRMAAAGAELLAWKPSR